MCACGWVNIQLVLKLGKAGDFYRTHFSVLYDCSISIVYTDISWPFSYSIIAGRSEKIEVS